MRELKAGKSMWVVALVALVGLVGCNLTPQQAQVLTGEKSLGCVPGETLRFEVVRPIFANRCQRCHEAGTKWSVASYTDIFAIKDRILTQVTQKTMPLDGPLDAASQKLMLEWLRAGAPEVSEIPLACDEKAAEVPGTEPSPPRVFKPTYNDIKDKFLENKCLSCHKPGGVASLYDFSTYSSMMTVADFIDDSLFNRDEPERSGIVRSVRADGRRLMPPTRSNIPPLAEEDIALLIRWIAEGAPEK